MAGAGIFAKFTVMFENMMGGAGKKMMAGMGIGLASSYIILELLQLYIDKALANVGAMAPVSGLLGLSGCDVALSVIIGAMIAKATISTSKLSLSKTS